MILHIFYFITWTLNFFLSCYAFSDYLRIAIVSDYPLNNIYYILFMYKINEKEQVKFIFVRMIFKIGLILPESNS